MLTILQGDALEQLRTLPDCSAQCCVTSPPYWGLRDYGTATWDGGDVGCDHLMPPMGGIKASGLNAKRDENGWLAEDGKSQPNKQNYRKACGKCGAKRIDTQIGIEETPEAYVARLVEVFREVRRVLKNDGTLWLNLGDSFVGANNTNCGGNANWGSQPGREGIAETAKARWNGLPPKNLVGIPWRVAFALQADGWYLRSDIIWSKPNPMPESVTDRPTKAHEYMFLLSKRERYFYDAEAIKEMGTFESGLHRRAFTSPRALAMGRQPSGNEIDGWFTESGFRNKRSVWTVPAAPYHEVHFATYPPDLIKPCILAGSRPGDTILDPFAGSGTTGAVAIELGRKAILIELNPAYIPLIEKRCAITPGFQSW